MVVTSFLLFTPPAPRCNSFVNQTSAKFLHSRTRLYRLAPCRRHVSPIRLQTFASAQPEVRDVSVLTIPMTAGGDMLFPGGTQVVSLSSTDALRILEEISDLDPPEFAYLPLTAWGDPAPVGTMAVIDDLQIMSESEESTLLCTGVTRFRIIHMNEDMTSARVELFHDDNPKPEEKEDLEKLEDQLVNTMTQIVQLSIKLSDAKDEGKQRALTETLKRVKAFCGNREEADSKQLLQYWMLTLSPHLRRELLSFIVIDLVSISFMDRKNLMLSTHTGNRLAQALRYLEPFVKELAAKGAIISALGRD